MDKKEEDKKGINLMPEDLRSKESGLLSKVKSKTDFGHDLVMPKGADIKQADYKQKTSFIDSIKNLFNRSGGYGKSKTKVKKEKEPEVKKEVKKEDQEEKSAEQKTTNVEMHVPDKDLFKDQLQVDYKNSVLGDVKKEKPSLLEQLKNLFSSKKKKTPNIPKAPKIERVPEKPIAPRELNVVTDTVKKDEPIDILDDKNIKTVPELKVDKAPIPPVPKVPQVPKAETPQPQMPTPQPEKKGTDFYIPNLDVEKEVVKEEKKYENKEVKEDKTILKKFHTPEKRIKAKFLDDGGGVDLIPDAVKIRSWRQIMQLIVITIFSFAFVIAVFYGFLYYQDQKVAEQKKMEEEQITSIEEEIVGYKELNNQIDNLGNEIKSIHQLLSLHFYWTNFFSLLEKYTIEGVYYGGMTAGTGGAMTLEANADSFDTLAKQITILEQEDAREFVEDVKVSSANYDKEKGRVKFNMTIVLNPSLFLYNGDYLDGLE